jgi:hypothetical protein
MRLFLFVWSSDFWLTLWHFMCNRFDDDDDESEAAT